MRPTVYISGPITKGDPAHNFNQAADAHRALIAAGFAPLNPVLSICLPWADDVSHAEWIASDLPWVEKADALLRLPGESAGADQEIEHALAHGVPVYRTLGDLVGDYLYLVEKCNPEPEPPKTDEDIRRERGKVYGDPLENHRGIAQMWASILQPQWKRIRKGKPVPASVVALCFALLKINRCRLVYHEDNYTDCRNYLAFAQEFQSHDN